MKPETLQALRDSIRKWEKIVAGTGVDYGAANCSLCHRFDGGGCNLRDEVCPVAIASGESECRNTPYDDWQYATNGDWPSRRAHDDESVMCAVLELEFLKELLPPGEKP